MPRAFARRDISDKIHVGMLDRLGILPREENQVDESLPVGTVLGVD